MALAPAAASALGAASAAVSEFLFATAVGTLAGAHGRRLAALSSLSGLLSALSGLADVDLRPVV